MTALDTAIQIVRGQAKLAEACNVVQGAVANWRARGNVPPQYCADIERITDGAVTRRQLRPEDWHRIWPELVTPEHPAPTERAA